MQDEELLRPRDVAHILDCCPDDLYPLIYAGEIKAEKVDYKNRVNGKTVRTEQSGKGDSKTPEESRKQL